MQAQWLTISEALDVLRIDPRRVHGRVDATLADIRPGGHGSARGAMGVDQGSTSPDNDGGRPAADLMVMLPALSSLPK